MEVRIKAPCKDCKYRHTACHTSCFLYKEWKTQTEFINGLMKKDRYTDNEFREVKRARVRKKKKV